MEELKRCPFCGGEVTIAEGGYRQTRWMYVTRGNKEKLTTLIPLKKTRKGSKPTSSKHGTNATKRIEHGQKTRQLCVPTILL